MAKDVLMEIRGSSALVDFIVIDMNPRQQTSIILGKSFMESINASIDEKDQIFKVEVEGKHDEFTFHPMDPTSFYQVQILYEKGSDKIKHVEKQPYEQEQPT
jgi:hypothetical protein